MYDKYLKTNFKELMEILRIILHNNGDIDPNTIVLMNVDGDTRHNIELLRRECSDPILYSEYVKRFHPYLQHVNYLYMFRDITLVSAVLYFVYKMY